MQWGPGDSLPYEQRAQRLLMEERVVGDAYFFSGFEKLVTRMVETRLVLLDESSFAGPAD